MNEKARLGLVEAEIDGQAIRMVSLVLALGLGILSELGRCISELLGLLLNGLGSLEIKVYVLKIVDDGHSSALP